MHDPKFGIFLLAILNLFWILPCSAQPSVLLLLAGKGAPDSTASPLAIGDGGLATHAQLINPFDAVADAHGNGFILDTSHQLIRKVDQAGLIETIAGAGWHGFSNGNGVARDARFADPVGLSIDAEGNLYVADTFNHMIRRIDTRGNIRTIAGTGMVGFGGDGGLAIDALLSGPSGIFMAPNGILYFADQGNNRIRKITTDGMIETVAGTGENGFDGDGGLEIGARVADPSGVYVGPDQAVYIADRSNHRVRKVNADGIIETVAGVGRAGFGGDGGAAIDAQLSVPSRIVVDSDGFLFIADRGNSRIRRVDLEGRIHTVLGALGELARPFGLSLSPRGELIVADTDHHMVHRVPKQERWISITPDRLEMRGDGQDEATFLAQLSGASNGLPVVFRLLEGKGALSVQEAFSVGGLVGTQYRTQNPGNIILEASAPGALPVSVALLVQPVHHLWVSQSSKTVVANGSNWVEIDVTQDSDDKEVGFSLIEGKAELIVENGQARLQTTTPGKLTVLVEMLGALPVDVDVWAIEPKPWQVPDAFEPEDQHPIISVGTAVARTFHNSEDVDWLQFGVREGYAVLLDTDQAIEATVYRSDGERMQTLQLPGEVFADLGDEQFQVALRGKEGAYDIRLLERPTATLGFAPSNQILVADGEDEVALFFQVLDRFGNLNTANDTTRVWVSVLSQIGEMSVSDLIVKEGVGVFRLRSSGSGLIEIQASVKGLEPVTTTIEASPALMLKRSEDTRPEFVDAQLIAGSGMRGITGIQARVVYDRERLAFDAFVPQGLMAGARPLLVAAVDGAVEINMAHFDGSVQMDGGLVGLLRFRVLDTLDRASDLILLEGQYGNKGGVLPFAIGSKTGRIPLGTPKNSALEAFQMAFGASVGENRYHEAFDLNANGRIDFADFLLWLANRQE